MSAFTLGPPGPTGPVPPGYVRLRCTDPAVTVVALLGADPPQLTGGFGGWSLVARPRETSMTVWDGVEPFELELPILLDEFAANRTQEAKIRGLIRVSRGDRESPPGIVTVTGFPLPVKRWVITDIGFGDPIRRASDAQRVRQSVTLTLREYVPPELLKRRRKSPSKSSTKTHIIKAQKGDTPTKIARRRHLKSWTVLRDLNRKLIKKANQSLTHGTKIRVPATKPAARGGVKDSKRKGK